MNGPDSFFVGAAGISWVLFLTCLGFFLTGSEGALNGVIGTSPFVLLFTVLLVMD